MICVIAAPIRAKSVMLEPDGCEIGHVADCYVFGSSFESCCLDIAIIGRLLPAQIGYWINI